MDIGRFCKENLTILNCWTISIFIPSQVFNKGVGPIMGLFNIKFGFSTRERLKLMTITIRARFNITNKESKEKEEGKDKAMLQGRRSWEGKQKDKRTRKKELWNIKLALNFILSSHQEKLYPGCALKPPPKPNSWFPELNHFLFPDVPSLFFSLRNSFFFEMKS